MAAFHVGAGVALTLLICPGIDGVPGGVIFACAVILFATAHDQGWVRGQCFRGFLLCLESGCSNGRLEVSFEPDVDVISTMVLNLLV
jgi:multisubunit Na+/H+ antiporter MnhB subunit